MNFIYILVIAVAVLTILAGLALVFGSTKSERAHSLWFLGAAIGEVIWAASITIFLSLDSSEVAINTAPWLVKGIYIGAVLMDAALLAYVSWNYKFGKSFTTFFAIAAIVISALLIYDPGILYNSIILRDSGNSLELNMGSGFYAAYAIYFCSLNFILCLYMVYRIRRTANKKSKKGYTYFLVGLMITGLLSGIFDLILPPFRYDLIWVGPLTIGLTILVFYFAILKYKMVSLNASWLKVLSSIVIVSSAFIVYLLIFHLVFSALFKVNSPSYQVVLLNFIMIAIVLALVPAFSEIVDLTKSLIMTKQINLPYIVKKLSMEDCKKPNLKDISGFLSEYMHFSYIAFLVNGKLYAADDCKFSAEELAKISKLPTPTHGAWQNLDTLPEETIKACEISRIAVLAGANGEAMGQMIFGKPVSKTTLEKKDLVEITMIVSLMGTIIEDGGRSKS